MPGFYLPGSLSLYAPGKETIWLNVPVWELPGFTRSRLGRRVDCLPTPGGYLRRERDDTHMQCPTGTK